MTGEDVGQLRGQHGLTKARRTISGFVALCMSVFLVSAVGAQQNYVARAATVVGTVRDSASGAAPLKTWVCAFFPSTGAFHSPRCKPVDTLGTYRLDSLTSGAMRLSVQCSTIRGLSMKELAHDSVVVAEGAEFPRHWTVSTVGCDHRALRRVSGVFRGHYSLGFETSDFVPCPADDWSSPGDSLRSDAGFARSAWVRWENVGKNVQWPKRARDRYGNGRYFVTFRGTVVGPGMYGHLGGAPFEFVVDSVLEVRVPSESDCR